MRKYPILSIIFALAVMLAACSKAKKENPTDKMGGVRKWKGHSSGSTSPPPSIGSYSSYSYDLNDTTFAIVINGPTSVSLAGEIFPLEKTDSANMVYYFGLAWQHKTYNTSKGIIYFSKNDSIVYVDGFVSHSMEYQTVYHTYK
jgi:hypothetical protein